MGLNSTSARVSSAQEGVTGQGPKGDSACTGEGLFFRVSLSMRVSLTYSIVKDQTLYNKLF